MFRPPARPAPRRGAILIVVLALLALFAVIGLSFVYYADSEATAARVFREAAGQQGGGQFYSPPDEEKAVNRFFSTLIYGAGDGGTDVNGTDILNALRGHELARAMYGWDGRPGSYHDAYSGVGLITDPTQTVTPPGGGTGVLRARAINHTYMEAGGAGLVLDPEWTGSRDGSDVQQGAGSGKWPATTTTRGWVSKAAGYTYPDNNNLYLASVDSRTGIVTVPSFHRPWLFRHPTQPAGQWDLDAANPNWTSPEGRLSILRPRPNDQKINAGDTPQFPYPPRNADGSITGDVQNLRGTVGVQKNDSVWLDIGLPPQSWQSPSGTKWVKPLVAPLIIDLDGRLNASAIGNNRNTGGGHVSFAGYGPWEIRMAPIDPTTNQPLLVSAAEGAAILNTREGGGGPKARNANVTQRFYRDPRDNSGAGRAMPQYAKVNWDGVPDGTFFPPRFDDGTALQVIPKYNANGAAGYDDNTNAVKPVGHPSIFNPNEWTDGTSPKVYPRADLQRIFFRYADRPDVLDQLVLGGPNPSELRGNLPPPGAGFSRLDKAHRNRMFYTTFSAGLDVAMLAPAHPDYNASALQPWAPPVTPPVPRHPYPLAGGAPQAPARTWPTGGTPNGDQSDYGTLSGGAAAWASNTAAFGPIDLNRELADYRNDPTAGPGPGNSANYAKAWADRQNFARDIFLRLVVATGAKARFDRLTAARTGNTGVLATTPGNPDYEAVRYLAQLAVNIVDYLDPDDVSTPFVWNPKQDWTGGASTAPFPLGVVSDTTGANAITGAAYQANFATAADIRAGVVFGTERPQLVVSEAYSEVVNDPTDPKLMMDDMAADQPVLVRFWIELNNPTDAPYANGAAGPQGTGSAQLLYEAGDGAPTSYSPYQVLVVRDNKGGGSVAAALRDDTNTRGDLSTGAAVTPDVKVDFAQVTSLAGNAALKAVLPGGGRYEPTAAQGGFTVLAPDTPDPVGGPKPDFRPPAGFAPNVIQTDATPDKTTLPVGDTATKGLAYRRDIPKATELQGMTGPVDGLTRHVVVLRRLANPYLPPNDPDDTTYVPTTPANPYVTVDYMDHVRTFDAVAEASDSQTGRMEKSATVTDGYDPQTKRAAAGDTDIQRAAVGRVHPYAGFVAQPPAKLGQEFPGQFLFYQSYSSTAAEADGVRHTFGRHNGPIDKAAATGGAAPTAAAEYVTTSLTTTTFVPFEWLLHLDRPVVNPLELLHASARKPHELTQWFLQPPPTGSLDPTKPATNQHTAKWFEPADPANGNLTSTGLYRALELLRVKGWGYGASLGGKVHGRVNLNTAPRESLLAVLDAPATVTAGVNNQFNSTEADTIVNALLNSRTPIPTPPVTVTLPDGSPHTLRVPGPTKEEDPTAGTDRPFRSLGAAQYTDAGGVSGVADTLLRADPANPAVPLTWLLPAGGIAPRPHPYQQAEAARKLFNNVTTVSNSFAVWVTVGFFEVRDTNTGDADPTTPLSEAGGTVKRHVLGAEVFREAVGDLRTQYFAIIDRSNLTVDVSNPLLQGKRPFFTPLLADAPQNATQITVLAHALNGSGVPVVYADGNEFPLAAGPMVIGSGAAGEVVNVTGVSALPAGSPPAASGEIPVQLTVSGLQQSHGAGTVVSNARLANPGPQPPTFQYDDPQYQPVIPYAFRLR